MADLLKHGRRDPAIALLASFIMVTASATAQAGLLDKLFGSQSAEEEAKSNGRRRWDLHEYTTIRLVPREQGSTPNDQPAEVDAEALRRQLVAVRIGSTSSSTQPLFTSDEVTELTAPLVEAFAAAGPNDDLLLLTTVRRDGLLVQPTAVTARLFLKDGRLQMIVRDTRYAFLDDLRGGRIEPTFVYGSRGLPSKAVVRSAAADSKRSDWLALPLDGSATRAAGTPAAPAMPAPATPSATATPVAPAAQAVPAAPAAAGTGRARDAAFFNEQEERLKTLKRLRERDLITEEEYQQKRREVLQGL